MCLESSGGGQYSLVHYRLQRLIALKIFFEAMSLGYKGTIRLENPHDINVLLTYPQKKIYAFEIKSNVPQNKVWRDNDIGEAVAQLIAGFKNGEVPQSAHLKLVCQGVIRTKHGLKNKLDKKENPNGVVDPFFVSTKNQSFLHPSKKMIQSAIEKLGKSDIGLEYNEVESIIKKTHFITSPQGEDVILIKKAARDCFELMFSSKDNKYLELVIQKFQSIEGLPRSEGIKIEEYHKEFCYEILGHRLKNYKRYTQDVDEYRKDDESDAQVIDHMKIKLERGGWKTHLLYAEEYRNAFLISLYQSLESISTKNSDEPFKKCVVYVVKKIMEYYVHHKDIQVEDSKIFVPEIWSCLSEECKDYFKIEDGKLLKGLIYDLLSLCGVMIKQ